MFHVKHCTGYCVSIFMYLQQNPNETTKTSYETSEGAAKGDENRGLGGVAEASAIPAGGVGGDVHGGKEASDVAAGRRRTGVVPAGGAGVPDADQPGSAEGDDRGEKEGAGVKVPPFRPDQKVKLDKSVATRGGSLLGCSPVRVKFQEWGWRSRIVRL
jgi:hypothetical protein